jgi:hypothetical protein
MRSRVVVAAVVVAAIAALAGCSSVLGIDSDRHLVDAGADDASNGPSWSCLSGAVPTPPAMATVEFVIGDPSTAVNSSQPEGMPIPGLVVTACTRLDPDCSAPLATSVPTDATGQTKLVVPGGFDGYFETAASGSFLSAIYSHEPVEGSQLFQQSGMRSTLVMLAAMIVHVTLDPSAGTVIPYVLDCNSQRAASATIDVGALGPTEHFYYLNQSIPSTTATATDDTGGAFALNVPAGSITVKASNAAGQLVASTTTIVRAGRVTFVQLRPSQATYQGVN